MQGVGALELFVRHCSVLPGPSQGTEVKAGKMQTTWMMQEGTEVFLIAELKYSRRLVVLTLISYDSGGGSACPGRTCFTWTLCLQRAKPWDFIHSSTVIPQ